MNEHIDEMIRKLQAIHYEWTCLIPRLTSQFRTNAETCRTYCEEVIAELNQMKEQR